MNVTVDTSVWIELLRDKTGAVAAQLQSAVGTQGVVMLPPVVLEVLQGCTGEPAWNAVSLRLSAFEVLPTPETLWRDAARLYFDLRAQGKTIRSSLDCCIAIYALTNDLTLIHNDRDFEAIAAARPLKHIRVDVTKATP